MTIPNERLLRLLGNIINVEQLRTDPTLVRYRVHEGGLQFDAHDLDHADIATLYRIASGEEWEVAYGCPAYNFTTHEACDRMAEHSGNHSFDGGVDK